MPDKATLSQQIQSQFGYDSVKADLAASKFGEEALQGKEKQQFFSSSAQKDFSRIEGNVTLEGESIYAKPYSCWYLQPKKDEKPRVVLRDETGKYAILEPQKMSRKAMREVLTAQLGITDRRTLDALTDKADRVADFYARQDTALLSADRTFKMEDFAPDKIMEHKYTGASGMEYVTKQKPLDSVTNAIRRTSMDSFTVATGFTATDLNEKGESTQREWTELFKFSLSDMGEAIRPPKEVQNDEETEIAPAVIDEDGEIEYEPEDDPNSSYYGQPDQVPEMLDDFDADFEVRVISDEHFPDINGVVGDSDVLGMDTYTR